MKWWWPMWLLGLGSAAQAHVASNGFLVAHVEGRDIRGSMEVAVRDVELAVGADDDGDGKVTWGELRAAERRTDEYLARHLIFTSQGSRCRLSLQSLQLNDRVDGAYAWIPFEASCPVAVQQLGIRYTVLDDIDPSHRALLTLTAGGVAQAAVLGGAMGESDFPVYAPSRWRTFTQYLGAGVRHILGGTDHLLFLLSLLLPAVLLRRNGHWQAVPEARPALISVLRVVTAFTLAHSITLTLSALDAVRLPTRLTESVIAASIIVAALNNVFPVVTEARARIAFAFGLLHGFGFASVLSEMGLPHGARLLSLLAFNLGIETGQLAVVLLLMPVAYLMRTSSLYQRALVPWGSTAIASLALVWLVQRALLSAG